jgi:hypothetical protein
LQIQKPAIHTKNPYIPPNTFFQKYKSKTTHIPIFIPKESPPNQPSPPIPSTKPFTPTHPQKLPSTYSPQKPGRICRKRSQQAFPISSVRLFTNALFDMGRHYLKNLPNNKISRVMSDQSKPSVREPSEHRIWK